MTRIVGIDHGTRRIGIAVGDTLTGIAFARPALIRRNLAVDLDSLAALVRDEDAGLVVVGLPRNMDGSEGSQAAAVRDFAERIGAMGIAVAYVDERLTSWQAAAQLADEGRRAERRSGELDSAAARLILQEYLDALPPTNPTNDTAREVP